MDIQQQVIAILVERLGGNVKITDAELHGARLQLQAVKDPASFAYILRTRGISTDEDSPVVPPFGLVVADRTAIAPTPVVGRARVVNRDEEG